MNEYEIYDGNDFMITVLADSPAEALLDYLTLTDCVRHVVAGEEMVWAWDRSGDYYCFTAKEKETPVAKYPEHWRIQEAVVRASQALAPYRYNAKRPVDVYDVANLFTDLMHFCDAHDITPNDVLSIAMQYYENDVKKAAAAANGRYI